MFDGIRLHGGAASLLWGYHTVAVLTSWAITRTGQTWTLTATLARVDRWQCAQAVRHKELLFSAPRDRGRWCWEVQEMTPGTSELRAVLGSPLQ